jgi:hypothetical protein
MENSQVLFTRREMMAAAGALAFAPGFTSAAFAAVAEQAPAALARAHRWVQLALVEKDPATFDPDWWLDFFRRVHADGACISAGGMCAYYPTEIPHHHRSEWLGDRDVFGDLVEGCRKLGMAVIGRVDPHCIREQDAQAHPDWVAVDADGNKVRHMVIKDRWLSCALGPCNMEFMPQVVAEIASRYGVDAIFANRWAGHIVCYCDSCQREFKRASGIDAPRRRRDPSWVEFQRWRQARLFEVWDVWDAAVQKAKPDCWCLMNQGNVHNSEMTQIGRRAAMVAADRQGRKTATVPPWLAGWNAMVFRSVMGEKPVAGITSVAIDDDVHRWKDSVQSAAELRLWTLECIAHGMRPWFVKFSGTIYDRRWIPVVEQIYNWHWQNERFLKGRRNLARVGVVWSPQTSGAVGSEKTEASQFGVAHALVEGRIPFEMVYEQLLDREHLERFKLLVLPNIAALSDAQAAQIRDFVDRGGSVLATFETSLYDETGRKRDDFALADLFGVRYDGASESLVKNSYVKFEHDTRHPILQGFEDAGRMINTIGYAAVTPTAVFAAPPLTRVPSYPNLPMEDVFPRQVETDVAEVYLHEVGAGRVAYFPGDVDSTFWQILDPDQGRVLANVVRWALDEPDVVSVTGPGVLDVGAWEGEDSLSVHLVNLTNPMMMRGPIRELYPVGPQMATVRLPQGRTPREVRLLVSQADAMPSVADGALSVTIPSIVDHEVIAVEF